MTKTAGVRTHMYPPPHMARMYPPHMTHVSSSSYDKHACVCPRPQECGDSKDFVAVGGWGGWGVEPPPKRKGGGNDLQNVVAADHGVV